MAKQFDYEVKTTIRLNMHNPDPVSYTHLAIETTVAKKIFSFARKNKAALF